MNDLTHGTTIPPLVIRAGQQWQRIEESPWPKEPHRVKIIDARDGWVRYYMSEIFPDERMEEQTFRCIYQPARDLSVELGKAKAPRDELEAVIDELLLRFHYREGSAFDREAAVRRAASAIGRQVRV